MYAFIGFSNVYKLKNDFMMNLKKLSFQFALTGLLIIGISSCKTEESETPELITIDVSNITANSASSGGTIISDGGTPISAKGVCWSTNDTPDISDNKTNDGAGNTNFISNLSGLSPNTTYFIRAYATNDMGTAYGAIKPFTTLQQNDQVSDIDGNVYTIIEISSQFWLQENLKTTKFKNGESISQVNGESWDNLNTAAYCSYDNNEENASTYGYLYNWYAVNDERNVCPEGFHIPTIDEWTTLSLTGLELKESGTSHWMSPNDCLTISSGFNALPGGNCGFDGSFNALTEYAYYWSADEENLVNAWLIILTHQNTGMSGYVNFEKWVGASVRCIKD